METGCPLPIINSPFSHSLSLTFHENNLYFIPVFPFLTSFSMSPHHHTISFHSPPISHGLCIRLPVFTSLCISTPLSLPFFAVQFFPYRPIKHFFHPQLCDISPSTSIHLLLTLSLLFPLYPLSTHPPLLPKHHHLTRSHSRSLHFSAHEICLTISGSAQGQIREAQPRKPQPLFLSSLFSSSLSSQLSNYLCST